MKKALMILTAIIMITVLAACGSSNTASSNNGDSEFDQDRVRVVIGSSATGGDSYQIADAASRNIEEVLGTNMKVDAIGANQAFSELDKAKDDGSTMFFFHDMTYLSVEYGEFPEKYELENWTVGPIVSTNPGNAYLARADAPYDTMAESAEWLKNNPEETITVAIEGGGVSEITFDLYYFWVEEEFGEDVVDRIKVYVTGSQEDKDQALWDGNADIIYGTLGANAEYTKDDVEDKIKMKFLGVTASEKVEGFDDVPTFGDQGITVDGEEAVFDKEFFYLLPKDVDEDVLTALVIAAAEISEIDIYKEDLDKFGYIVNYMPANEAKDYLIEKRDNLSELIEKAPNLDDITK